MSVTLIQIEVRNGDINRALKLFKKRVEDSGHIQELRRRKEYKKPSTIKREKRDKVLYRLQRERTLEQDKENGRHPKKKTNQLVFFVFTIILVYIVGRFYYCRFITYLQFMYCRYNTHCFHPLYLWIQGVFLYLWKSYNPTRYI